MAFYIGGLNGTSVLYCAKYQLNEHVRLLPGLFMTMMFLKSFTQDAMISGQLKTEKGNPVDYATVYNLRNHHFTFSNESGHYELPGWIGDTLQIRHVAYEQITVMQSDSVMDVLLQAQIYSMNDLIISPHEPPSRAKRFSNKSKDRIQYGLVINSWFRYRFENFVQETIDVQMIRIPVRFREGFSNDGAVLIEFKVISTDLSVRQFYRTIPIEELINKASMEMSFSDLVLKADDHMELIVNRAVENGDYEAAPRNYSVNPFLHLTAPSKSSSLQIRRVEDADWIDFSTWIGKECGLQIEILGEIQ